MKIKLISFLFIVALIYSCQQAPQKADDKKIDPNETWVKKTYYEKSGALKSEITIKNKKKNGLAKEYYPTGELRTLVNYVNNIKEGETVWYYKNGTPYRVTPYINGQMEGIRKIYYENGKLKAEIPYRKGEVTEGLKEYNSVGELISNYPKIIFKTKNNLQIDNTYSIICKMSNDSKSVSFFQEVVNTENKKSLKALETKNGIAIINLHIPSQVQIDKEILIYAKLKTSLGNPYITKETFQLKVDTR